MNANPVTWESGTLTIIDQTLLPAELKYITLDTLDMVWSAIKQLQVRGAPAIGVCAAFGVLVALKERHPATLKAARHALGIVADHLATSRPTAVNLFWALDRMRSVSVAGDSDDAPSQFLAALEREAQAIYDEDRSVCKRLGAYGAPLIT
ncbi:MAG: S-methyl-5-thioribose-1-phosphate isomerase, partial [Candidatus Hydrogenedentes bacterium]|nr:S-methyl-5-thioribose-1-phosphate isomerase [Candidatus Hydrogenedentota bacterium]